MCLTADAVFKDLMYLATTMMGLLFLSRTPIWSLAFDPASGRADQDPRSPARCGCCWGSWSRGPLGRVATYDRPEGRAVETLATYVNRLVADVA
jgi:hypothetical protein